MAITDIMKEKNMTIMQLSKKAMVPYSTLNELIHGKKSIYSANTLMFHNIATALDMTMDDLYNQWSFPIVSLQDFELFKSETCHEVKTKGAEQFIVDTIVNEIVEKYWEEKKYAYAFYMVAMVDYLCRINKISRYSKFKEYRMMKLPEIIYPLSVYEMAKFSGDDTSIYKEYWEKSISEFKAYNIVEGEIFDVV